MINTSSFVFNHLRSSVFSGIFRVSSLAFFYFVFAPHAFAETYRVTNNDDAGNGSLRQAIENAYNTLGEDTVDLTGVSGTINLNSSLVIRKDNDIKIEDDGNTTISGQGSSLIMVVDGANVVISNLTFTDGLAKGGDGQDGGGGGLGAGGALFINAGNVTLNSVAFRNNKAIGGNGGQPKFYSGAAIKNNGSAGGNGGKFNVNSLTYTLFTSKRVGTGGAGGGRDGKWGLPGSAGGNGDFGCGGGSGGGGGGGGGNDVYDDEGGAGGNGGNGGYGGGGGGGGGGGEDKDRRGNDENGAGGNGGNGGDFGGKGGDGAFGGSGSRPSGRGGGGAALGGAIFVNSGSALVRSADMIQNPNEFFSNNSVQGGDGNEKGKAEGQDIFFKDTDDIATILKLKDNNSAVVPIYLTAKNMNEVAEQIANNKEILRQLAVFAHSLGFDNAGGTASSYVGEDFNIQGTGTQENPIYILTTRYNIGDKYAQGRNNKIFSITLSNFQASIDPTSFKFKDESIRSKIEPPLTLETYTGINESSITDVMKKTFSYTWSNAVQNITTSNYNASLKGGLSKKVTVDAGALKTEIAGFFEVSISGGQAFTTGNITTETKSGTIDYSASIPPRTERVISLVMVKTLSSIDYNVEVKISFDVDYEGALRVDNARSDQPKNRPSVKVSINTDQLAGINSQNLNNITDNSGQKYVPQKFKNKYSDYAKSLFKEGIIAPLSGTFTGISGTSATAIAREDKSLDATLSSILENPVDHIGYPLSRLFSKPIRPASILSVPNKADQGIWQYAQDGQKWENISNGQILSGNDFIRFLPAKNYSGKPEPIIVEFEGESIERWINATVTGVNNPPILSSGELQNISIKTSSKPKLRSLRLGRLTYSPGNGNDEATQTLTVMVKNLPKRGLGRIFLSDGKTLVTYNTSYTIQQLQGMLFRPKANAKGVGTFDFSVIDNGGTENGGKNTLDQSIVITVK
jgi:hypothetical protein